MSQFPDPGQPTGAPNPFAASPGGFPPQKKTNVWLWVLLGAGGGALLLCCGCAGIMTFGWSKVTNVLAETMIAKLNADPIAQQHLGTVTSAKFDVMASGEATQKAGGVNALLFHVVGDKGKGDVIVNQAPGQTGNNAITNGRLILPSGEEIKLDF